MKSLLLVVILCLFQQTLAGGCFGTSILCSGSCSGRYECRLKTQCDYYEFGSTCGEYCVSSGRDCKNLDEQERCESYRDCKWSSSKTRASGGSLSAGAKAGISIVVLLVVFGVGGFLIYRYHKKRQTTQESSDDKGAIDTTGEINTQGSVFDKAAAFLGLAAPTTKPLDATETRPDKDAADEATDIEANVGIEVEEGKEKKVTNAPECSLTSNMAAFLGLFAAKEAIPDKTTSSRECHQDNEKESPGKSTAIEEVEDTEVVSTDLRFCSADQCIVS